MKVGIGSGFGTEQAPELRRVSVAVGRHGSNFKAPLRPLTTESVFLSTVFLMFFLGGDNTMEYPHFRPYAHVSMYRYPIIIPSGND